MWESSLLQHESSVNPAIFAAGIDRLGSLSDSDTSDSDLTDNGKALQRFDPLRNGSVVLVESHDGSSPKKYFVRHSTRNGDSHSIRLQLCPATRPVSKTEAEPVEEEPNYYEILQISPESDSEAIHRVYRIMAARFHPDNPETGDIEKFYLLKTAYEVLSDPDRRSAYDARHKKQEAEPMPVFELKDFVTGVEAESNRRLGVLSLLYNQRRLDPDHPSVGLLDLEHRMAFPREYLNFTMWYLRSKGFVQAADNSDYTLTVPGADFVEANIGKKEILAKLLFPAGM